MKIRFIILLNAVLFLLSSCEREIKIDLEETSPKLVVEGTIENGEPPVIILTNSLNYFSGISAAMLANSFVRNAEVFVSSGSITHRLKEFTIPGPGGVNFYYYSNDPANPATAIFGQLNKQYSLRIVAEGKEYTSTTSIPDITRRIDSVFWKLPPPGNDSNKVMVMIKATDKPGFGDYVRYYTKRNSEPFYPGLNSVFDDQVIDGSSYEVQVERGVPRTGSQEEGYSFFNKGDTVTLKLSNIDKATYDFWRTMEFSYASIGNPFSTPTKVTGNISGALGYFGGYASQFRTLIIPK
jgi:hypothetical protein